jgi:hypothetical protein
MLCGLKALTYEPVARWRLVLLVTFLGFPRWGEKAHIFLAAGRPEWKFLT